MAIAGLVLGAASSVLCVPVSIALMVPAIQKVREAAASVQSMNNLKMIGVAMHNYHDLRKHLPQAAIFGPNGEPLLSWRVAILPEMEHQFLYDQFHLNEPWDSPHNIRLLEQMPVFYKDPRSPEKGTMTHYQAFVARDSRSPGPAFRLDRQFQVPLARMPDGTSNTVLIAEATRAVPWTKPEDLPFPWPGGMPELGVTASKDFNVLMGDGAVVRRNLNRLNPETLRLAVTMDDGQPLPPDWFSDR
jgi:hypothetical protein